MIQKFRLGQKVRVRQHGDMPSWASDWRDVVLTIVGAAISKTEPAHVSYTVIDRPKDGGTDGFEEFYLEAVEVETPPVSDLHRFINALKIMRFIEIDELRAAGIEIRGSQIVSFENDPYHWLMLASDEDAAKVWAMVEAQQPERNDAA